ncbi:MAG: Uma2 family endonuclease, partial [Myxococcota bacterium]
MQLSIRPLATASILAELERHEVLGGRVVRKAAPSGSHGNAQFGLAVALGAFRGRGDGAGRPGGWWFGTEVEVEFGLHEVYLPDMAGWRIEHAPEPPTDRPVRLCPQWVAEILSPSTAERDRGPKRAVYHATGVEHYWLLDPNSQTLTVLKWTPAGYIAQLTASAGDHVLAPPFAQIELDIASV